MCNYMVIDLEMCRLPKSWKSDRYRHRHEIIQVGAVILNEEHQIVSQFDSFVKPDYGTIDAFIKQLTGITRNDIKDAPDLKTVLEQLIRWMPEDVKAVSWSDTDKKQLEYEMAAKNIQIEGMDQLLSSWIDCQKMFGDRIHASSAYALQQALVLADIPYLEGAHNGFIDAWNTALLFAKLLEEPDLQLNDYYREAQEEARKPLTSSIASLLGGLQFTVSA